MFRVKPIPKLCRSFINPRPFFSTRKYSTDLDPSNKADYAAYVAHWTQHFQTCQDNFELERGLNHIFSADWIPDYHVIVDAIKACRRLNTFATAVRVLEALQDKAGKQSVYEAFIKELKPLLDELGVPEPKELGEFKVVRDPSRWWY